MRVLRGLYEGPGSHGILRVAASVEGVQAVLRAYPEEGYFSAIHGALTRSGDPAPVSLSPVGGPGLARDLQEILRRSPDAEAVILVRSEAALLSGEEFSDPVLPESSETGRRPKLVTCPWESPSLREIEAADLALEELVRVHARPQARSLTPTVNIFGPPLFGPGAEEEAREVERLLNLLGIGATRVPLGTSVGEFARLPRAWANIVLYREVGEAATRFLQNEFGMPRVTTPPLGSAGTGAVMRAVGELCSLDAGRVRRTVWAELARTAKLPWYARLAVPETFAGRRAVIFGDFTYALGLGYTLAREVGLEVAWAGTYLSQLEKDFLFQAGTFTEEAFVTDDPDEVAARVEEADPDLIVGTHLEGDVADALGIPFLPLCPPVAQNPFVGKPLMGYSGSSVLADALDGALGNPPREHRRGGKARALGWTEEALEALEDVPAFLRGRTRRLAEERARAAGSPTVTPEILEDSRP